jgi:hypothetical protein
MKSFVFATLLVGIFSLNAYSADKACQATKDCKGRLPKMCVNCTNGNTGGCAHWSCEENVCKVKTCDIPKKKPMASPSPLAS